MLDIPEEEEETWSVMNLDSGDLHPLDHPVCDGSSDDLSSSEFCDLLKDMPPPDWNQWLDELMEDLSELSSSSSSSDDSLYDVLKDMSPDEWAQVIEDVSFDLDDFVA